MPKVWQFGETIKGNDKLNYIKYKNIFSLKNNLGELKKKTQETNQEKAFSIHGMDKGLIHKTYKFTIQIPGQKSNNPIKPNIKQKMGKDMEMYNTSQKRKHKSPLNI